MPDLIIWLIICVFAVWQSVEICHHSQAGTLWRITADKLRENCITKYLGDGMSCPYCYSNWFGILYAGCYSFSNCSFITAIFYTFIGGLAAARGANMMNDWMHVPGEFVCRTPNSNPNSVSEQVKSLLNEEFIG